MVATSERPPGFTARLQAWALDAFVSLIRMLGPVPASNLGGWLARATGPVISSSRTARANLRRALPALSEAQRGQIVRGVWDNLGRTAAELAFLAALTRTDRGPGWEIEGEEHLARARAGGQVLFFSGHFGNWEMILPIAAQLGMPMAGFYRAARNKGLNTAIQRMREGALGGKVAMFAKGSQGAREAMLHLRRGGSLGLLVDQKMNDGIAVPFFGEAAMTAPAIAQFAIRFNIPIVPVRVVRLGPARFRLVCEAALSVPSTGSKQGDTYALMVAINATLERWIRADPGAWLWLHRRWPKPAG